MTSECKNSLSEEHRMVKKSKIVPNMYKKAFESVALKG